MTLKDFISALKTSEIKVKLQDSDENEVIKFYSDGYTGVESDLLARTVHKWIIESGTSIVVTLKDEVVTSDTASASESESESQSESETAGE